MIGTYGLNLRRTTYLVLIKIMEDFGMRCHTSATDTAVLEAEQVKIKEALAKNDLSYLSIQGSLNSILQAHAEATQQSSNIEVAELLLKHDESSSTSTVIAAQQVEMHEETSVDSVDPVLMQRFLSSVSKGEIHDDTIKEVYKLNEQLEEVKKESDDLKTKLVILDNALNEIKKDIANIKQYLKRDNLLFHKCKLPNGYKNMSSLQFCVYMVKQINFLLPHLDYPLRLEHISTAHPLKTKRKGGNVIVVRFCNRFMRDQIFAQKDFISNKTCAITEHLTEENLNLYKKVKSLFGFDNTYTEKCSVFVNVNGVSKFVRSYEHAIELFDSVNVVVDQKDYSQHTLKQHARHRININNNITSFSNSYTRAINSTPYPHRRNDGGYWHGAPRRRRYSVRNRKY